MCRCALLFAALAVSLGPQGSSAVLPFTSSLFFNKPAPAGVQVVVGDIAQPDVLAAVLAKKVHKGELIVFSFNAWMKEWVELAVNMCAQLHHVGFSHFVAISPSEADCSALTSRVPYATCVWSSFPGVAQSPGWEGERRTTEGLWIQRVHVSNLLAAAGANVLLVDLDVMFYRDPYPELHGELLGGMQLIHLKEGWSGNGGCFYMQQVKKGSAALWTHTHVVALAMQHVAIKARDHVRIGAGMMDQELFDNSLYSAGCNASALYSPYFLIGSNDQAKAHPFWQQRSAARYGGETAAQLSGVERNWACGLESATAHSYQPAAKSDSAILVQGDDVARWAAYLALPDMNSTRLAYIDLEVPADAELTDSLLDPDVQRDAAAARGGKQERYATAPAWVFGHCRDAHAGWHAPAVMHLVGCGVDWTFSGYSMVNRRVLMVAAGAWRPAPDEGLLSKAGQRGYLSLSQALVSASLPPNASKQDVNTLLQRLLAAAAAEDRIAVLPAIDCALWWIHKEPWALHGVYDRSIIKYRRKCYPGPGGGTCTHLQVVGEYEMHALHATHGNVTVLDAWPAAGGDAAAVARLAALRGLCPGYWEDVKLENPAGF